VENSEAIGLEGDHLEKNSRFSEAQIVGILKEHDAGKNAEKYLPRRGEAKFYFPGTRYLTCRLTALSISSAVINTVQSFDECAPEQRASRPRSQRTNLVY
jgi:hypothetical protein